MGVVGTSQSEETRLRLFRNRKTEKLKQLILLCTIANESLHELRKDCGSGGREESNISQSS